jgi:hypothetical protein
LELRAKLAKAIEALILPRDHAAAIGDAAKQVVLALLRAPEIDETDAASDRRLVLEILTPRGNDDYQSHAAKLKEVERQQAGRTLFHLYAAMTASTPHHGPAAEVPSKLRTLSAANALRDAGLARSDDG